MDKPKQEIKDPGFKLTHDDVNVEFRKVPKIIWKLPIDSSAKIVLMYIIGHQDHFRFFYTKIGEVVGLTRQTVAAKIDQMLKMGLLIEVLPASADVPRRLTVNKMLLDSDETLLKLLTPPVKNINTPLLKDLTPPVKNFNANKNKDKNKKDTNDESVKSFNTPVSTEIESLETKPASVSEQQTENKSSIEVSDSKPTETKPLEHTPSSISPSDFQPSSHIPNGPEGTTSFLNGSAPTSTKPVDNGECWYGVDDSMKQELSKMYDKDEIAKTGFGRIAAVYKDLGSSKLKFFQYDPSVKAAYDKIATTDPIKIVALVHACEMVHDKNQLIAPADLFTSSPTLATLKHFLNNNLYS